MGNAERPYLAVAQISAPGWKHGSRGRGSLSPFIIPKTEKNFQINIEPHINTMQYIRETYIKCVKINMCQVLSLNIFFNHFAPYLLAHNLF